MTWVIGLNEALKSSIETSKYVKVPEGGSWSGILRLDKEPRVEHKTWNVGEQPKATYYWLTGDGRELAASEKLSLIITNELLVHKDKLPTTTECAVEIHRKGTKTKPEWFVFIKGGF